MSYFFKEISSPLGILTLASDGSGLIGLWIEKQKHHGKVLFPPMEENKELSLFQKTEDWIDSYFRGEKPKPSLLALSPIGTPFQQQVWKILQKVPYGTVTTYGEIAKQISGERENNNTLPYRAVGGAVARNPISILIPCHRVIGKSGNLTGYAGGIKRKIWLLEKEGIDLSHLFSPTKK